MVGTPTSTSHTIVQISFNYTVRSYNSERSVEYIIFVKLTYRRPVCGRLKNKKKVTSSCKINYIGPLLRVPAPQSLKKSTNILKLLQNLNPYR